MSSIFLFWRKHLLKEKPGYESLNARNLWHFKNRAVKHGRSLPVYAGAPFASNGKTESGLRLAEQSEKDTPVAAYNNIASIRDDFY